MEIINQISEFEESDQLIKMEKEHEKVSNLDKAKTEASYTVSLKDDQVVINHENLQALKARFYKIDLEAYYSLNPFQEKDFT